MLAEAEDVLLRYKGENPIVQYYLGYIQEQVGKKEQAGKYFKTAQMLSENYCFPFRLETVKILNSAITFNPNDGKAYYYLGNILYDKQPDKAIEYWEKAIKLDPGLAMAYRNLGWGYYYYSKDIPKAIPYYEKAIALDHSDAILYTELDNLYELNNSPLEKRVKIFEGNEQVVNKRDDAFVRQITVLTLAGKPEKSIELLKDKVFSYREGNSRVREVIMDAQLSMGLKYMSAKQYQKALDHFLLAQVPDEEAGSARSGNRDIQVNYFIGQAFEALKMDDKAKGYYTLASKAETAGRPGIMSYYQGLCFQELKDKPKADEIYNSLVENGDKAINRDANTQDDFFASFGEKEAENNRKSQAYTLRGLGYKGLGKTSLAKEDLKKAVELSVSNLWANTELKKL
jgi:tetratricopeptide (TPR) repeat protein